MHTKLLEVLAKQGLKEEQLSPEEKVTFDNWNRVLSNEKITLENVRDFCNQQKTIIESMFGTLDNSSQKNDRLVLMHSIYSKIARVTVADHTERLAVEAQLNLLIDSTPTKGV
jgi:hypothetical protein